MDTTTTTTTILRLSGLCLGQPERAGTRRNIHLLKLIAVINHLLSGSSIFYDPRHPPCSIYVPGSLFPQSLSKFSLVYPWPGTLHFILHTFLHPIIVFFNNIKQLAMIFQLLLSMPVAGCGLVRATGCICKSVSVRMAMQVLHQGTPGQMILLKSLHPG